MFDDITPESVDALVADLAPMLAVEDAVRATARDAAVRGIRGRTFLDLSTLPGQGRRDRTHRRGVVMYRLSSEKDTEVRPSAVVRGVAPLALCGLLLTGCAAGGDPADPPGSTSQQGDADVADETGDDSPAEGPAAGDDDEVSTGGVTVGTKIPDNFPADFPLPEKAPTSVVTVGEGMGKVGGGIALNYDGVSKEELGQVLKDAESAGYTVGGPFENGSSELWNVTKGEIGALVVFSEGANLSMTVTTRPS